MRSSWTSTPAEVKAAFEDPNRSSVWMKCWAAERAEREYAAEAATYAQTPRRYRGAGAGGAQRTGGQLPSTSLRAAMKRWTIALNRWTASTATGLSCKAGKL